jgi:hypothetical protein
MLHNKKQKDNNNMCETLIFYDDELQKSYLIAKHLSEKHLKYLDKISNDIKKLEKFLDTTGYGEYTKSYKKPDEVYDSVHLTWRGGRIMLGGFNLIETKVKQRMEAYPYLSNFLKSIAYYHEEGKKDA